MTNYIAFVRDITEEELTKQKALDLQENLDAVEEFTKIVFVTYQNGEYSWTSEIYNILKISPKDYPPNTDILSQFIEEKEFNAVKEKMKKASQENNKFSVIFKVFDSEGTVKYLKDQIVYEFDSENNLESASALIQDVTDEELAKKEALNLQRDLDVIEEKNNFVITHFEEGNYYCNKELYNILEINPDEYSSLNCNIIERFTISDDRHPDPIQENDFTPEQPHIHNFTTIKTPNGNVKILESYIDAYFDENGRLIKHVAFVHEITEKFLSELKLEELSEERKILLQEVHHRVKNNLQLISSFLSLDSRYYSNDPNYVIKKAQNRLDAMALTHEEIYQSDNMSHINLESLLVKELISLFNKEKLHNIQPNYNIEPVGVDIDKAMPLSLIVNELAFNTIKHAFPDNSNGNFYVDLETEEDNIILKVWDDGIGLPQGMNMFSSNSLGFVIIRRLISQLEAQLLLLNDVSGFGVEIIIPN